MSTSHSDSRTDRVDRAAEWSDVVDELLKLRSFDESWDGRGAVKPDAACVDAALRWVQWMRDDAGDAIPPTSVAASPGGEVVLVWQVGGTYVEAEIAHAASVEWLRRREDGSVEQWESGFDVSVA